VQVGTIGLMIELGVKEAYNYLNLSTASIKNIIIKKPSGMYLTVSGSYTTNGTDGKIYYTTREGDLSEAGVYKVQGQIAIGTFSGYTTATQFTVVANI
jgi:hypothetical protein